jgi:glutaredoxin-like protein
MIPLREQESIRQRFAAELTSRLRVDLFTQRPTRLVVPGREECLHCEDVRVMLEEIASLSPRVALSVHEFSEADPTASSLGVDRVPAVVVRGQTNRPLRFFGMPYGRLFPVFIEAMIEASTGAAALAPETQKQLKKIRSDVHVQLYVSPICPHSPGPALTALRFALMNRRVSVDVIEALEFPQSVQRAGVRVTPTLVVNGKLLVEGALNEAQFLTRLLKVVEGRPLAASESTGGASTPLQAGRPATGQGQLQSRGGLIIPR